MELLGDDFIVYLEVRVEVRVYQNELPDPCLFADQFKGT